jgi:uncharacterized membrane protein YjfL (UPF0719 family)
MKSSIRTFLAFCLGILGTMLFGKPVAHALDNAPAVITVLAWAVCTGIAGVLAWDASRANRS